MKVLEIKGLESVPAFNAFYKMLLGINMLPQYAGEHFETFLERVDALSDDDKEKFIREGVRIFDFKFEETLSVTRFCADNNGVPYTMENMKSLSPMVILEIVTSVFVEISKFKLAYLSDTEKKNSKISQ